MSTRTPDLPRSRRRLAVPGADLGATALRADDLDADGVRRLLTEQRRELEAQMRRSSLELHRLRTTSDVSDPDVQPALMAALRALDSAEREAIAVSDALGRLDRARDHDLDR